jgi:hypothetical protein
MGFFESIEEIKAKWELKEFWLFAAVVLLLFAYILKFIVTILLKMGIVGKILLTALFIISAFIFFYHMSSLTALAAGLQTNVYAYTDTDIRAMLAHIDAIEAIKLLAVLGISAGLGIGWFWPKHYAVIKNIPSKIFSVLFLACLGIAFWGFVAIHILIELVSGNVAIHNIYIPKLIAAGVPSLAAIILWLTGAANHTTYKKAIEDEEEDAEVVGQIIVFKDK